MFSSCKYEMIPPLLYNLKKSFVQVSIQITDFDHARFADSTILSNYTEVYGQPLSRKLIKGAKGGVCTLALHHSPFSILLIIGLSYRDQWVRVYLPGV